MATYADVFVRRLAVGKVYQVKIPGGSVQVFRPVSQADLNSIATSYSTSRRSNPDIWILVVLRP